MHAYNAALINFMHVVSSFLDAPKFGLPYSHVVCIGQWKLIVSKVSLDPSLSIIIL